MANNTIYPFGPGGQTPSTIPIADDLLTERSDMALSAKQGTVIRRYIMGDSYNPVDLSAYTVYDGGLGTVTTWYMQGKHKTVPVVPGEMIKIKPTGVSGHNGGFYTFLNSGHSDPVDGNTTIPYVNGMSRVWCTSGTTVELTVPTGAAFLCITTKDGAGETTWEMWVYEKSVLVPRSEIVNNLVDGGIDVPLSAEQGKIIGPYVFDTYESVDLTQITESNFSLGNSNNWYNGGKHKVVPVTPGDSIKITVSGPSSSNGGFWAFFTSAYTPPSWASEEPPYVSGERVWAGAGSIVVDVPDNAAYLCICTVDGGGAKTWQVDKFIERSKLVQRSDIVNDPNNGGSDVPLSAKLGKRLNDGIFGSSIPYGLTKYDYNGRAVATRTVSHKVAQQVVSKITSVACQGGACYGDFLFLFKEDNTTCWIFNLANKTLVQTYTIPSEQRGFVSNCHCNTVNFGTEFYDSNDQFPLIYVSTGYNDGTHSGALVYRIVATTSNDTTTYSLSLVQTIKIPGAVWTEFIVGEDGNCIIKYVTGGFWKYYRFTMPKLNDGDITLNFDNALEEYVFSPQPVSSSNQNHIYFNGKIYLTSGSASAGLLIVLDLATRTRDAIVNLAQIGINQEPETLFFWNGNLCIAPRSNTNIWALYFE